MGMVDGADVLWRHREGRVLTIRLFGHVVETEHGPSFDASVMDLTELASTTAELRRQRAELERTAATLDIVVRQVSAVYWLVDPELRILRTGGAVREVFGYEPGLNIGKTLDEVLASDPTASRDTISAHRRALAGEHVRYSADATAAG